MKNKLIYLKHFTTLILIVFSTYETYAQRILKKKEVASKLTEIQQEINQQNFEKAIQLFRDKDYLILIDNVRKKDIERYNKVKSLLSSKTEMMSSNKRKVNDFKKLYDDGKLCDATLLLSLNLSKENSYNETLEKFQYLKLLLEEIKDICNENKLKVHSCKEAINSSDYCEAIKCSNLILNTQNSFSNSIIILKQILPQINVIKEKCAEYITKIDLWETQLSNREYKNLLIDIPKVDLNEQKFIPSNLKKRFILLKSEVDKNNKYIKTLRSVYYKPIKQKINDIHSEKLTYLKAQEFKESLKKLLNIAEKDLKVETHKYPFLHKETIYLKKETQREISNLNKFIIRNRPQSLNLANLYNKFTGAGFFGESEYTEVQKKYFWNKDYYGKTIFSSGIIHNIQERIFSSNCYITIKVADAQYVDLYLDSSQKEKLLELYKGQYINFIGELDKLGSGTMFHHKIKNVKISENY